MLAALMQSAQPQATLELRTFARRAGLELPAVAGLAAVRWLAVPVAAFAIATPVPAWAPLVLGASVEPVRLWLLTRLRRRLRAECLRAFADAALEAPDERATSEGAAWRASYVSERAIAVDVVSLAAALLTASVLMALVAQRLGVAAAAGSLALLSLGLVGAWLVGRQRRSSYRHLVDALRHVGALMNAAAWGRSELRAPTPRRGFLARVLEASNAWSAAEATLQRQRSLGRGLMALIVLTFLAAALGPTLGNADLSRATRAWAIERGADLVLLAALVPSMLVAARSAHALLGAERELDELRPFAPLACEGPRRLLQRPRRLRVEGLEISYGTSLGVRVDELSVELDGPLAIVGRNGSGKTTLARALAGLVRPTRGLIELDGMAAHEIDPDAIAFVPQEPVFVDTLSVAENIRLVAPNATTETITACLAELGLDVPLEQMASSLSRGEQHRIALARAMLRSPELLVLDEPDAWLDAEGRERLTACLGAIAERTSLIVVTHRTVFAERAARVLVLEDDHQLAWLGPANEAIQGSGTYRRLVGD